MPAKKIDNYKIILLVIKKKYNNNDCKLHTLIDFSFYISIVLGENLTTYVQTVNIRIDSYKNKTPFVLLFFIIISLYMRILCNNTYL